MKPYKIISSKIPLPKKVVVGSKLPKAKIPKKLFTLVNPPKFVIEKEEANELV